MNERKESILPKLIFATGNANKVKEVAELLDGLMDVQSLKDIGFIEDIPEDHPTLEANAIQKAQFVYDRFGVDCFSEDTGMEVRSLNNEPGVYSARYAGPARDDQANMDLVLKKLAGHTQDGQPLSRQAQFRTVVALILDGQVHTFTGIVKGQIAQARKGAKGFGYDPIFVPEGFNESFAQMDRASKNSISHRGRAIAKLVKFLKKL